MAESLNILFVASEVSPYSKTGGLGDVASALPRALHRLGHRITVMSPLYRGISAQAGPMSRRLTKLKIRLGNKRFTGEVCEYTGHDQVRQLFLDVPSLYDRDGIYNSESSDFEDNPLRYAVLSKAAVSLKNQLDINFDVIHANDWQGGLIPLYLTTVRDKSARIPSVFTIHNLAYQGLTSMESGSNLGIPKKYQTSKALEFYGQLNLMKSGILHADAITTVSPTYADEICTEENGAGLHGVISEHRSNLTGILNGVDYGVWSPETDQLIPAQFDASHQNGKRQCKAELTTNFELQNRPRVPLIGVVSRLVEQKGIDLFIEGVKPIVAAGMAQVVLIGEGDKAIEESCRKLQAEFPEQVGIRLGYQNGLAHHVYAGSDIFAMPSRFEPCGLSQLYAMRYGAIPVVRSTGGLRDTVRQYSDNEGTGVGFRFDDPTAAAFEQALRDAITQYHKPRHWRGLVVNAMGTDFSWKQSAERYANVYERVIRDRQ